MDDPTESAGLAALLGDPDTPAASPRRRPAWSGPLAAPCGACTLAGWGAFCVASCVPCASPCLFATTRRRLLGGSGLTIVALLLLYVALLYVPGALALALAWRRDVVCLPVDLDARGVTDAQRAACAAAGRAAARGWGAAAAAYVAFAGCAAAGRRAARARHGLAGSSVGDAAAWLACPCLALAQEARTAEAGGCVGGVWGGRAPEREGARPPPAVFAFER